MTSGWIAAIATCATAAGAFLLWLTRKLWLTLQRTIRFLDDYFGQPAREGVPGRPGVMARLSYLEGMVRELRAETQPNGGTSLRDVVHRTAADVADIKQQQAAMQTQIHLHYDPDRKDRDEH